MCTWEEASLQCFSTRKWMFFSLLINKGTIKHLYVLCLESKVESLASHENLCSSLRVLFQSSRCLQRPSQPNRKYKKKADRKVYSVPQFLGDAEYQSLKAAFIAAWDCSLGMISVYQWLFPWFFIYSIFLSKQNKPSFHFTPVQFLWKEGRPFAVVFFLQRSLWQVQWDFVERSMIMAGTGGISIALLHLNNECVGGETSPSLWASEGENLLELHSCGNLGNTSDTLVLKYPLGAKKGSCNSTVLTWLLFVQFWSRYSLSNTGADNIYDAIEDMIGYRPGPWMKWSWIVITPVLCVVSAILGWWGSFKPPPIASL